MVSAQLNNNCNRETDIKDETFPNSIFAKEAFGLRSSTVTFSYVCSPFRVLYLFVRLSLC